jgi:exonuclease SbcC
MIPVKLSMRNFMCYRDNVPPLYFDGIHLACLSGDNGNGKSAIIDAMTWALWGKTRLRSRSSSDDDLIHATQTEMEVNFDFAMGHQLYRIIRKHSRPKRQSRSGQSALELQIYNDNGFRSITGNSMTQTQQNIIDILRMDYDTFINSAYLRQGHADEFTSQTPAKRKEVLSNILGLSLYDRLEEQAKELAKQQEAERAQLESTLRDISDELAQRPAHEAELQQAQSELSRIEEIAREKESGLNTLRQSQEALQNKKAQLDELEARLRDTVKDLERWQEQARQHHSRLKEYEEVIGRRTAIEEGYAQFVEARKTDEALEQKFRQSINLERKRTNLENKITEVRNELIKNHAVVQSKIEELNTRTKKLPGLRDQLGQVQAQMRQLAEQEITLRQKEENAQEMQKQVSYLEAEITRLAREISEVAEKLDIISSHVFSHTEAICPLCERELTREGLMLIETKYNQEKQSKSDLLNSNRAELARKQMELESRQKESSTLESWLDAEKTRAQSQASVITKEIKDIEEADKQLTGLRGILADIELRLATKDFATTEQEALLAIEAELVSLGYDSEKHEQVRQQLGRLEPYEHDKRRLEEAARLIHQEKEAVSRAEEEVQGKRNSLESDSQKKETLAAELTQLPRLLEDLARAEAEYRTAAAQRSQAQETVGRVKAKLQRCAELEIKKTEKEAHLSRAAGEENIYKELAKAFGKEGVQAMIIETSLPELEAEANLLLARMTDNRMHVQFKPQGETRKGSTIETLDINIADELGTRNYEMFSGGEAFRINFAIRIALSRLLAKRAGAPLRTLIIDEGFGTQDSAGLEKLKEAINSIQEDFDKILVITHIEELRDAFPTRIDVIKTAEGSTISVN